MTTPDEDKNGHKIGQDGKLVHDERCHGCDATDDVTRLLEELETILPLMAEPAQKLLAYIRHQQEQIATLEGENRKMREGLESLQDGHGCPLHQCGIIADRVLSSITTNP